MPGEWLYDDAMYRFAQPVASYWEATAGAEQALSAPLTTNERCDVAVIGGGYTGLSAAYHLCRDYGIDARVLEAGHIGWGASGRNGGFCSLGGEALGAEAMVRKHGLDDARAYYRSQVEAVRLVHDLIVDENIDTPLQGDSEVAIACSPQGFEHVKAHAEFQFRMLGLDTKVLPRGAFGAQYFDIPLQHGAAITRPTFGLHPMRYVLGLGAAAVRHGATLYARSEVIDWSKDGDLHVLCTDGGSLRANHVVLATNGFMPEHLDRRYRGQVLPLISSIVVTRPLSEHELASHAWQTSSPAITAARLLNYFRILPDNRFLFGGRGSTDGSDANAAGNYARLVGRMHELFPAWREVEIDYRWHGLVCMTRRLTPAIGRLQDDPSVFFGFGYHGNGVNTATWSGKQIADWLGAGRRAYDKPPASLPRVVHGMPGRFPLASMRLYFIRALIAALGIADRISRT